MREFGKVKEYDNYYGKIITADGEEYLLLNSQIIDNQDIKQLDYVTFVPEIYKKKSIARFVKKYEKTK